VWSGVEHPVDRQRLVGWNLQSRVAEQQLRRGGSCSTSSPARNRAPGSRRWPSTTGVGENLALVRRNLLERQWSP
jgi:hypothetical protein